MPHGAPDWHKYRKDSPTFPLEDLAELAARLGSIVTFDRRGELFWFDDFEHGLQKWYAYGSGTGNSQTISPTILYHGGYAAKLATGSDTARTANLLRYFPSVITGKWGAEFSFNATTGMRYTRLDLGLYDGATYHSANVRYDWTNNKLQYQDADLAWQDIATAIDLPQSNFLFHTLKLVADFTTDEYVRCILNQTQYSLPDIPIHTSASAAGPYFGLLIQAQTDLDANHTTYIDYCIVTQNEP